jgi:hypothetical protein
MYWLVSDWTGVPAAGIVAGLLHGFHRVERANVVHPHIFDLVHDTPARSAYSIASPLTPPPSPIR